MSCPHLKPRTHHRSWWQLWLWKHLVANDISKRNCGNGLALNYAVDVEDSSCFGVKKESQNDILPTLLLLVGSDIDELRVGVVPFGYWSLQVQQRELAP